MLFIALACRDRDHPYFLDDRGESGAFDYMQAFCCAYGHTVFQMAHPKKKKQRNEYIERFNKDLGEPRIRPVAKVGNRPYAVNHPADEVVFILYPF